MSDPVRFLVSFAQALATMALYTDDHPARSRAIENSFRMLKDLQAEDPSPDFSFLGHEVVYRQLALRDLKDWEPSRRLSSAGVQRLEFEPDVTREDYELFLEEVLARTTLAAFDSSVARPSRPSHIKFGTLGIRGEQKIIKPEEIEVATAKLSYSLFDEADAVRWMHEEVATRGNLPLLEAEMVVNSLAIAMHSETQVVLPLAQLRAYDEYTTTHSLNVSVLSMALAEYLGLSSSEIRTYGVAGLLHDLGKVRVPLDILNKPGKLTEEELRVMQMHPVDGARMIVQSREKLDLAAAVAYEHHIMINGRGYPNRHYTRPCHTASLLVHVCDVYDALRTDRPYRPAWSTEKTMGYMEERAGVEFHPEISRAFVSMMRQWERRTASITTPTAVPAMPANATAPAGGQPPGTGQA